MKQENEQVKRFRCARCNRPMFSGESIVRTPDRILMVGPKCLEKMFPKKKKPKAASNTTTSRAKRVVVNQLDFFEGATA